MELNYIVGTALPNNLWQLMQDYCVTTEDNFMTDIPTFVQLAESKIYNMANFPVLRTNVTGALTVGNKYLSTPPGWISTYSLAVIDQTGVQTFLINKDVNYIREAYPDPTALGFQVHYAQFDEDTLIIGPTPDFAYGSEMHYKAFPESITTAGNTWLGENFGEVLLWGALCEAYVYQKGEQDMMAKYKEQFMEGVSLLKQVVDGADRQDVYRSGQIRLPQQ